ncbi:LuxR C-terminal-related transcriptional regulator [Acinetobacter pittii]|uniref:LuxR C-terminal-related transcriptional regulator n=1 Tax=Acinetobacter pittii TaxID=48296 RepID=UPI00237FE6A6|nr:LuxR C-terminal-related transcriptional regulator [Acinetobacter pittii]MDE4038309.1 LuxR C-terminal-related transcriptional regulator [Acinetobacter pittii]WPP88974.1 LuxR C-terminal-related transcriptional regulator [Acinetobacter pittii]
MSVEQENYIIGLIYDAALQPELWEKVLEEIAKYTQSKTANFTAIDQLNPKSDFVYTYHIPIGVMECYEEDKINVIDMKLHGPILLNSGIGTPTFVDWSHYAEMQGTDEFIFYQKCLEPTGISYANGMLLDAGKYHWAVLAVHRESNMGTYSEDELNVLKRFSTHLRRALQIHKQFSFVQQKNQQFYQILDCLKIGVIILNQDHSLHYSNRAAQKIFEKSTLLSLDKQSCLKTLLPFQERLEQLIKNTFSKSIVSEKCGGVIGLYSQDREQTMMLTVAPLSQLDKSYPVSLRDQHVALFLTEQHKMCYLATDFIKTFYKLSKRELQICELFVNGLDFKEISETCGITISSVRTYFKQIFAKTGCNSQVELMNLLMKLVIEFEHIH